MEIFKNKSIIGKYILTPNVFSGELIDKKGDNYGLNH